MAPFKQYISMSSFIFFNFAPYQYYNYNIYQYYLTACQYHKLPIHLVPPSWCGPIQWQPDLWNSITESKGSIQPWKKNKIKNDWSCSEDVLHHYLWQGWEFPSPFCLYVGTIIRKPSNQFSWNLLEGVMILEHFNTPTNLLMFGLDPVSRRKD